MKHAPRAALITLALTVGLSKAFASASDYQFQLVQNQVKKADAATITVRLIDKRTGKNVPNAVIFTERLDMSPDGMAAMTSSVQPMPSTEPGLYPFKADLSAPGGWRLSLAAKVQGEADTITGKLDFKAIP